MTVVVPVSCPICFTVKNSSIASVSGSGVVITRVGGSWTYFKGHPDNNGRLFDPCKTENKNLSAISFKDIVKERFPAAITRWCVRLQ